MNAGSQLDSHGPHQHNLLRRLINFIVYAKVTNAEHPWREWIGTHWLSVSCFSRWLMAQLRVNRIEDDALLPCGQHTQMLLGFRRIFDLIGHV